MKVAKEVSTPRKEAWGKASHCKYWQKVRELTAGLIQSCVLVGIKMSAGLPCTFTNPNPTRKISAQYVLGPRFNRQGVYVGNF